MKTKTTDSRGLDILGSGAGPSDREIFTAVLKQWRRRLGYCSIFAAVPTVMAAHSQEARSDETTKPEASVAGRGASFLERLKLSGNNPRLLKRQSDFLLPHQKGSFAMRAPLSGTDDCPGRMIPGGNYSPSAPYLDSGDTTGANDTVSRLQFYYYYTIDAFGPDVAYSFTLTARGANPQIQVSTTSGSYRPLIYVLPGGYAGACPTGIGNYQYVYTLAGASAPGGTATLGRLEINSLPLNVPLHMFVDSSFNDASGSGPYTLRMQDVSIAPAVCPNNPIDCPEFFLQQHYFDFLNREPDPPGFAAWLAILNNCVPGDASCDRLHVSGSFFQSPEFQERGSFAYRLYAVAFGRKPNRGEFIPDLNRVSGFLTAQALEGAKVALVDDFMMRPAFVSRYAGQDNAHYVDLLLSSAGVTLPNRQALIDALNALTKTRAQVFREIVDSTEVYQKYYNQSFVVMQYFGYLRRDPDALYLEWIRVLDTTGDSRTLINGFVNSPEYRARFGS